MNKHIVAYSQRSWEALVAIVRDWKRGRTPKWEKMGKTWKIRPNLKGEKWRKMENRPDFPFLSVFSAILDLGEFSTFFPVFLIFGVCVPAPHECKALETLRKFECSQEKVVIPVFFFDLPSPCFASPASVHFLGPRLAI